MPSERLPSERLPWSKRTKILASYGFSSDFTTIITHLRCVKNGSDLTPLEQGNVHDSYIITDVIKYAKALLMHQLTPINQSSERIFPT